MSRTEHHRHRTTGSITAIPNPIRVSAGTGLGATTILWTSEGTEIVEAHIGTPDGPLLSRSGPTGSATTGKWVHDEAVFHLQNVSGGLALSSENTLGKVTVNLINPGREGSLPFGKTNYGDDHEKNPLVSCVIIFLNAERFIEEAIDSVFAQTYKNWELLLVDDGSTDLSTDIALRYARQYSGKVHYIEHELHQNRGMSAARNLGVRHSKGAYIAFLDSDDVWLPQKLERQVEIMEAHPEAGLVYGPVEFWYGWSGNSADSQKDMRQDLGVPLNVLIQPPAMFFRLLEEKMPVPLASSILVRRESIMKVGGFEPKFRALSEDLAFASKMLLESPVFVIGDCLSRYRQHIYSVTELCVRRGEYTTGRPYSGDLFFLKWLQEYMTNHDVKNPELWKILKKRLWPFRHPFLSLILKESRIYWGDLKWYLHSVNLWRLKLLRRLHNKSIGYLRAEKQRFQATDRSGLAIAAISWISEGTQAVEVHIGSPDGPLFARSGPAGSATTGKWVHDKMRFYLQDVTDGKPLSIWNTLHATRLFVDSHKVHGPNDLKTDIIRYHYGGDITFQKGIDFLDGNGTIEDWGCGFAYAKNFTRKSIYIGVDESQAGFTDRVVQFAKYRSRTDCIFMRHLLEHRHDWRSILANAIKSFRKRMVLIISTPFSDQTVLINDNVEFPDISFKKEDLAELFKHLKYDEETCETDTQYKREHIFYITKWH